MEKRRRKRITTTVDPELYEIAIKHGYHFSELMDDAIIMKAKNRRGDILDIFRIP